MDESIFICPVCSSSLSRIDRSYKCINSHIYDISKDGYVNLILANQKHSREPGDSREMLEARKSFLNRGYYKPLARSVVSLINKYRKRSLIASSNGKLTYCQRRNISSSQPVKHMLNVRDYSLTSADPISRPVNMPVNNFTILDAGCGEGYYTNYISKNNYIRKSSIIYGIDISKDGIKSASKQNSSINFAVAGIFNLPIADNSVDLILNIFAPFDESEFGRVLKDKGIIISVAPGAYHLYEFKKYLYDEVYINDEVFELSDKFHVSETLRIKYELNIHNATDIENLLKMTPYYHKSSREKIELFLKTVNELKTTADFVIRVISTA